MVPKKCAEKVVLSRQSSERKSAQSRNVFFENYFHFPEAVKSFTGVYT